ncbi:MAG: aldo/keto reductase [Candidatus Sericytochromatia bacterium]
MNTRQIGQLSVSEVGLGCNNFGWKLDESASVQVVHAALEQGITFFDTADMYGRTQSERFLGKALKHHRQEVVIASKFGKSVEGLFTGSARPDYVRQAVDASLQRLGTDYIDLYQLHSPDASVPIADTLEALNQLVKAGKVREIGCSNFSAAQLREAENARPASAARFVSVQNEYSLLERSPEAEVLPQARELGLAFLPFFPLASGLLTGKYRLGRPLPDNSRLSQAQTASDPRLPQVEALLTFAEKQGHSLLELAFSWLLAQTGVASVIAGATRPEQVQANARAAHWSLSPEELAAVTHILNSAH